MHKQFLVLLLVMVVGAAALASGFHFGALKWYSLPAYSSTFASNDGTLSWADAVKKVEENRGAAANSGAETPSELRHYEDRHWFLASQVAEVKAHQLQICHDFVDLAGMIERGEMVTVPPVTSTYVLYGVGEETDDEPFIKYQEVNKEDSESTVDAKPVEIELYSEAEISEVYKNLDDQRSKLQPEIEGLKSQMRALKKSEGEQQKELEKEIAAKERELTRAEEKKSRLDKFYAKANGEQPSKEQLFSDYETLRRLAQNFGGTIYNLDDPASRKAMKGHMLSSLRPAALKVLEEVAAAYHAQFGRPLPVSSLVRPEQYQHALRRVNRNAVTIETPPHSTGLAFDINYRWMSGDEQTFVMNELAQLKRDGRIEAIRERNANYHVFAFINGTRPSDELVAASREEAGAEPEEAEAHDANKAEGASKPKESKTEARGRKLEVRDRRSEVRGRKSVGSRTKSQKTRNRSVKSARKRR